MLFVFLWPNNRLKMVLASPNDQKYPRLKIQRPLARLLRLVILYSFKLKFLSGDPHMYLHDSKCNLALSPCFILIYMF